MPFFYLTHEFFLPVAHGLILIDKYKKIRLCFQKWSIFTVLLGVCQKGTYSYYSSPINLDRLPLARTQGKKKQTLFILVAERKERIYSK